MSLGFISKMYVVESDGDEKDSSEEEESSEGTEVVSSNEEENHPNPVLKSAEHDALEPAGEEDEKDCSEGEASSEGTEVVSSNEEGNQSPVLKSMEDDVHEPASEEEKDCSDGEESSKGSEADSSHEEETHPKTDVAKNVEDDVHEPAGEEERIVIATAAETCEEGKGKEEAIPNGGSVLTDACEGSKETLGDDDDGGSATTIKISEENMSDGESVGTVTSEAIEENAPARESPVTETSEENVSAEGSDASENNDDEAKENAEEPKDDDEFGTLSLEEFVVTSILRTFVEEELAKAKEEAESEKKLRSESNPPPQEPAASNSGYQDEPHPFGMDLSTVWPFTHCKIILSRGPFDEDDKGEEEESKEGWGWEGKHFVYYKRILSPNEADELAKTLDIHQAELIESSPPVPEAELKAEVPEMKIKATSNVGRGRPKAKVRRPGPKSKQQQTRQKGKRISSEEKFPRRSGRKKTPVIQPCSSLPNKEIKEEDVKKECKDSLLKVKKLSSPSSLPPSISAPQEDKKTFSINTTEMKKKGRMIPYSSIAKKKDLMESPSTSSTLTPDSRRSNRKRQQSPKDKTPNKACPKRFRNEEESQLNGGSTPKKNGKEVEAVKIKSEKLPTPTVAAPPGIKEDVEVEAVYKCPYCLIIYEEPTDLIKCLTAHKNPAAEATTPVTTPKKTPERVKNKPMSRSKKNDLKKDDVRSPEEDKPNQKKRSRPTKKPSKKDLNELEDSERGKREKKEWPCEVCEESYSSSSDLKIHMRIHSSRSESELPYTCPMCSKRFEGLSNAENHLKKSHGVQNPKNFLNLLESFSKPKAKARPGPASYKIAKYRSDHVEGQAIPSPSKTGKGTTTTPRSILKKRSPSTTAIKESVKSGRESIGKTSRVSFHSTETTAKRPGRPHPDKPVQSSSSSPEQKHAGKESGRCKCKYCNKRFPLPSSLWRHYH